LRAADVSGTGLQEIVRHQGLNATGQRLSSGLRSSSSRTGGDVWRLPECAHARFEAAASRILASGAAQLAASNRPLPGAETALLLYDRYFSGENPGR
jgi:hypothetical protein